MDARLTAQELLVEEPLGPPGRHQDEPITLEESVEDVLLGARALRADGPPDSRTSETRLRFGPTLEAV